MPNQNRFAVPPAQLGHAVDHPLGGVGHIDLVKIVVAAAAVAAWRDGMLAEIGQNVVAQALCRLAVALHRLQALQVALAQKVGLLVVHLGKILFVQQKFVDDDVLRRKKQHALRRQPVTPGTARLLVIILHALGHVVVQHEPHVGLVNAHAKGVRRYNDRRGVVDEVILIFAACFGGQARVVLCGRKARIRSEAPAAYPHSCGWHSR